MVLLVSKLTSFFSSGSISQDVLVTSILTVNYSSGFTSGFTSFLLQTRKEGGRKVGLKKTVLRGRWYLISGMTYLNF